MKRYLLILIFFIGIVSVFGYCIAPTIEYAEIIEQDNETENNMAVSKVQDNIPKWELTLVNYENALPSNFSIDLSNIDDIRQFDSRAISYLNEMLADMKKDKILDIWVQSSYRSIEHQRDVFNAQVNKYMKDGKTQKEAEELTLKIINKPGTSEHNLGLAVDFNYVDESFEKTKAFVWLKENAEDYGFILRYKKEDESITKVEYEPWHWRYVGVENAKEMNRLNMCLEEYVDYLMKV